MHTYKLAKQYIYSHTSFLIKEFGLFCGGFFKSEAINLTYFKYVLILKTFCWGKANLDVAEPPMIIRKWTLYNYTFTNVQIGTLIISYLAPKNDKNCLCAALRPIMIISGS